MAEADRKPAETRKDPDAWTSGDESSQELTPPHPSPAEGAAGDEGGAAPRPPRPSQAEGERHDEP